MEKSSVMQPKEYYKSNEQRPKLLFWAPIGFFFLAFYKGLKGIYIILLYQKQQTDKIEGKKYTENCGIWL